MAVVDAKRHRYGLSAAGAVITLGVLAWQASPWSAAPSAANTPPSSDAWHPFVPVTLNVRAAPGEALGEAPELATRELLEHAALVLGHFDIPFEWRAGELFVTRAAWSDKEMMLNITSKALDTAWLEAHPPRR